MATNDCKSASTEAGLEKGTISKELAAALPKNDATSSTVLQAAVAIDRDRLEFHLLEIDALLQAATQQCALIGDNCDDLQSFKVTLEALADKGRLHASEAIETLEAAHTAGPRSFDNGGVAQNATAIERCAQCYFDELVRNPAGASLGLCLNDLGLKLTAEAENDLDCFGTELHKRLVELLEVRTSRSSSADRTRLAEVAMIERAELWMRHAGELLADRGDPAEWDVSAVQALAEKSAAALRDILEDAAEAARPEANPDALEVAGFDLGASQVLLKGASQKVFTVPLREFVRDDAMVARVPAIDALRIGIEFAQSGSRAPKVGEDLAEIATLACSCRALAIQMLESAPPGMGMLAHAMQAVAEKIGYMADRHADAPQAVGSYDEWIAA
jgi:hypothetical protein